MVLPLKHYGLVFKENYRMGLLKDDGKRACTSDHRESGLSSKRWLDFTNGQGSQYLLKAYEERLCELGIAHSYSQKGYPYDNASIESFHAILKKEEVYQTVYPDFESAKQELFRYIEGWYNQNRIHSRINYLTPNQVEQGA